MKKKNIISLLLELTINNTPTPTPDFYTNGGKVKKSHGSVTMTLNAVRPRRNVVTKRRFRLTGAKANEQKYFGETESKAKTCIKDPDPKHTPERERKRVCPLASTEKGEDFYLVVEIQSRFFSISDRSQLMEN